VLKVQTVLLSALQVLKDYKEAKALRVLPVLVEFRVILFQVLREARDHREARGLQELKGYRAPSVDQAVPHLFLWKARLYPAPRFKPSRSQAWMETLIDFIY
jgi:hypothetical protein